MCYFGFLRSGEVTVSSMKDYDQGAHLSEGDVRLDNSQSPTVVQVDIKQSKTDLFRRGVMVYLGKADKELCPVVAVLAYLAVRGRAAGPFFTFWSGSLLTRETFVAKARAALREIGVEAGNYAGHSFRIVWQRWRQLWGGGFSHSDFGKMEKCSLSGLHSNTETPVVIRV